MEDVTNQTTQAEAQAKAAAEADEEARRSGKPVKRKKTDDTTKPPARKGPPGPDPDKGMRLARLSFTPPSLEAPGPRRRFQYRRRHVKKLRFNGRCAVQRSRASVCRCLSVCKKCCSEPYVCKCDKGVWANMTPLKQKYSCERSE